MAAPSSSAPDGRQRLSSDCRPSATISPVASIGCTIDTGAIANATTCSPLPATVAA